MYISFFIHIHVYMYLEERISDACLRTIRAHVCVLVCARACVCALRRMCIRAELCEHLPPAVDRVRLGAGVRQFEVFRREHRRVEHRVAHLVVLGMRRLSAGGAPPRRARSVGARCGAALVRDGTADARARMRACTYTYSAAVDVDVCVYSRA